MILSHALARLEKRLQRLVEDNLDGIFTATDLRKILSHELLMALQREARQSSDGKFLAPDQFSIFLPPETARRLADHPSRVDELCLSLVEAIEDFSFQAGYTFNDKLSIRILTDQPSEIPQTAHANIVATYKLQDITQTASLGIAAMTSTSPGSKADEAPTSSTQTTAFMIVNGVEIFPLPDRRSSGVINIGRLPANQLVLEYGRVSRIHAQLRIMQGRYMLFDLASTYGTFVNGLRINTHELKAGDVISFGGVPVVFGIEEHATQELRNNMPPDNPTA